jgi:adenylate cyclase
MIPDDGALRENFGDALRMYRNGNFTDALKKFEELCVRNQDHVSSLYAERCRVFIISPPPAEWDGVFVAKTK